jgi:hypothetical protein
MDSMKGGRYVDITKTKTEFRDYKPPVGEKEPTAIGRYSDYATWEDARWDETHPEVGPEMIKRATMGEHGAQATFPGLGQSKILASWLWGAKELASPNLQRALRGAYDAETYFLTDATMGPGVMKPPYIRGGGNAVNPAFRTAVLRPAAELHWEGSDPRVLEKKKRDALRFGASLRSLNPSGGTYANEADPESPNWQHAFWGSNYPRLLQIKRQVDPQGVFWCRACVGSELWRDIAGQLCRGE